MKKLEELKKLLVVVDMVNGFVREGNMADPFIFHIIPTQIELIKEILEENEGISFIKDTHSINASEFDRYPIHCVENTKESELVDELVPYEKGSLVYKKNSTSTIFAPKFLSDIEKMKSLKEVIIGGCCTDICVTNLAIPLQNYFDEVNRKVKITIPIDVVETYNSNKHNREEYNNMSFKLMEQAGINLVKTYRRKK